MNTRPIHRAAGIACFAAVALAPLAAPAVAQAATAEVTVSAAASQQPTSQTYLEQGAGPVWCSSPGVKGAYGTGAPEDGSLIPLSYPAAMFAQHTYNPWLGLGHVDGTITADTATTATVTIDVSGLLAADPSLTFPDARVGDDQLTLAGGNLSWTGTLPQGSTAVWATFASAATKADLVANPDDLDAPVAISVEAGGSTETATIAYSSDPLDWVHTPGIGLDNTDPALQAWYGQHGLTVPGYGHTWDAFGYWFGGDDDTCLALPASAGATTETAVKPAKADKVKPDKAKPVKVNKVKRVVAKVAKAK